jgi:hypothetical protein
MGSSVDIAIEIMLVRQPKQNLPEQPYQHPTNKALVWQAKGKKPKWLIALETDGDKAMEPAS